MQIVLYQMVRSKHSSCRLSHFIVIICKSTQEGSGRQKEMIGKGKGEIITIESGKQ